MTDLWPADIGYADDDVSGMPLGILKEQASLLGRRTKNIVRAEVIPRGPGILTGRKSFAYEFNIVAPFLEDYRFKLFAVRQHAMKMYPLDLILDDPDLISDLYPEEKSPLCLTIKDEETFEGLLINIFNATSTKNLIKLLINQSNVLSSYEEGS
jgi:hypothetical protein